MLVIAMPLCWSESMHVWFRSLLIIVAACQWLCKLLDSVSAHMLSIQAAELNVNLLTYFLNFSLTLNPSQKYIRCWCFRALYWNNLLIFLKLLWINYVKCGLLKVKHFVEKWPAREWILSLMVWTSRVVCWTWTKVLAGFYLFIVLISILLCSQVWPSQKLVSLLWKLSCSRCVVSE